MKLHGFSEIGQNSSKGKNDDGGSLIFGMENMIFFQNNISIKKNVPEWHSVHFDIFGISKFLHT